GLADVAGEEASDGLGVAPFLRLGAFEVGVGAAQRKDAPVAGPGAAKGEAEAFPDLTEFPGIGGPENETALHRGGGGGAVEGSEEIHRPRDEGSLLFVEGAVEKLRVGTLRKGAAHGAPSPEGRPPAAEDEALGQRG